MVNLYVLRTENGNTLIDLWFQTGCYSYSPDTARVR